LQKQYSIAFRKLYCNAELISDETFINSIITKHIHSNKAYDYLAKEVLSFKNKEESYKEIVKKNIIKLYEKLKNETNIKIKSKIQKKISLLNKSLNSNVVFGGKRLLQVITKQKNKNLELYLKNKRKFADNRLLPLVFYGESESKGNRFFNLKKLAEGEIIFKYENSKKKISILFFKGTAKHKKILNQLSLMCQKKEIPITIKLTTTHLCITYEEGKINGKWFNNKQLYKNIKHLTNKNERKAFIAKAHLEHEQRIFGDKLQNRYCAVDLNPKGIGYCIADKTSNSFVGEFKVTKKGFIDFNLLSEKNISYNKRRYEISIAIRNLFLDIVHHKVCHFIVEDLKNISGGHHGNKSSNRQINNIWCRTLITQLSDKWCAFYGIKKTEINPVYSSFIGNILHDTYDPIAASIEICRRGMIKYTKGGHFLPSFHKGVITDVANRTKMDYNELQSVDSWKELCKSLQLAKKSVRRADKNIYPFQQLAQNRTEKSKVKTLLFL